MFNIGRQCPNPSLVAHTVQSVVRFSTHLCVNRVKVTGQNNASKWCAVIISFLSDKPMKST